MPTAQPDLPTDVRRDTWRGRVERDLKGADFDRALVRQLLDGVAVQPLEDEGSTPTARGPAGAPGAAPFTRGRTPTSTTGGWDLRVSLAHPDPRALPALAEEALAGGATSARVVVDAAGEAGTLGAPGVVLSALSGWPEALGLHLVAPAWSADDWQAAHDAAPGTTLALDPLGAALAGAPCDVERSLPALAPLVMQGGPGRARVSTLAVADAGGSAVLQLAWMLSSGAEWLRALDKSGARLDAAAGRIAADLAVGTQIFAELAKVRAARLLWARLTEACGQARGLRIHAIQARSTLTRRDPHTNLLRGTVAAAAAVLGGADAVTVLAFDERLGPPGPLARRLARTTQLLLRDESHLHRLVDPAGGSWSVERLTLDLAERAWSVFQELEAAGGAAAAIRSGLLRERVDAAWAKTARDLARRKQAVTGVSAFPLLEEALPEPEPLDVDALRVELGTPPAQAGPHALPFRAPSEPWEALRDASDALLAERGSRPQATLVVLGPLSERSARTTWAENLLTAGGFALGIAGPDEPASAPVAVLCGADVRYADAGPVVARLRGDGAVVACAGRPDAFGEAPAPDHALFAGSDVLSTLTRLLAAAGAEVQP